MGLISSGTKIPFTKMAGAGNDFIMVDNVRNTYDLDWRTFAVRSCALKTGIGADGVIVIGQDARTDFTFRIFNADGSEAEMCGNGARCAALFAYQHGLVRETMRFRTLAGIIGARINSQDVAIEMTDPFGMETGIAIDVAGRKTTVHFINTGVPHTVIFSDHVADEPVFELGRAVRNHSHFAPGGTNADFVQVLSPDRIHVRTYERGVENETYACGTGAVAAAIVSAHLGKVSGVPVSVRTQGGELKIDFKKTNGSYSQIWLMGPVDTVFTGEIVFRPGK
ncbi:MAG TPA: diaminopimelate epimerase [Desulfomonilia bacterium]|nr:diaminopimelate epimerase [Desulfomonilia bacterium]